MATTQILSLLVAAMACLMQRSFASTTHIVGGSCGWIIPPNNTFYQDWASARTFFVGDQLVFQFTTQEGTSVMEVSKDDFDHCTQYVVYNMLYMGPATVALTKPGPRYFYSGVGRYCEDGQKLSIHVCDAPSVGAHH